MDRAAKKKLIGMAAGAFGVALAGGGCGGASEEATVEGGEVAAEGGEHHCGGGEGAEHHCMTDESGQHSCSMEWMPVEDLDEETDEAAEGNSRSEDGTDEEGHDH